MESAPFKKCTNCDNFIESDAKFCSFCGAKQEPKKRFCSECGAELKPEAKFCSECGTPASVPTPSSEPEKPASLLEKIKDKGGIIVYNDNDEGEVDTAKKFLSEVDPEQYSYVENEYEIREKIERARFSSDVKWNKFGEPGRDIQEYGYPTMIIRAKSIMRF